MSNANRTTHPIEGAKSDMKILTAQITGGGAAADCTLPESGNQGGGEILSCVYAGSTGQYTITFRHPYPALKCAPVSVLVGTTDGLRASFSAIDITAGTATMETWVGNTATDMDTTDTLHLLWVVRHSGRNT